MSQTSSAALAWTATLGQLQLQVTQANFDTWLRDTVGLRHEDGRFVVGAQTDFATEWLATRLRPLISRTLASVLGYATDVAFEVMRPYAPEATPALLPLAEAAGALDDVPAMFRRTAEAPALNPSMTFETFVVGDENALAHTAACAAAGPVEEPRPLAIFGTSGLGKTHLLSAIGHRAHAAGRRVIYATAERFGNDYVRALGARDLDAFRARYRRCDVLIVDDVQFFSGKEKFQEEFFHTFNELHDRGAQIVVSTDRAPAQLEGLMEALRSRLQWGLVADLQTPGAATRLAILRAKASRHAAHLPDDVLVTIAERFCPSVRELEGYLNRVIAYAPLTGAPVTSEIVDRALTPLAQTARPAPIHAATPASAIVQAVCDRTGASAADLRGRTRARAISYARHLAMYILREDACCTVAEIGRMFGNRDHSTVLGGIRRIHGELKIVPETSADLAAVRDILRNPPAAPMAAAG